jgi:pimeloyl-ACP methyl ester carboxylesterase
VVFDRPGHGRAPAAPGEPGRRERDFIEHDAGLVRSVLDRAAIERCVLFGHSVGGAMALAAAAQLGARVSAVITEGAQSFVEDITLAGIRAALAQEPATVARLAKYHGANAQRVFDAWTKTWLAPDFAGWSLAPLLPRVRARVLAIHGENDEFGSVAQAALIARLTGGQTLIMPDVGHVPHREREAAVIAAAAAFLEGVA